MKVTKRDFLDQPPSDAAVTAYDEAHAKLYLRLLDAEAQGAAWQDVVEVLFGFSAKDEPERASRIYAAHLARARWMKEHGFAQLVGSRLHQLRDADSASR